MQSRMLVALIAVTTFAGCSAIPAASSSVPAPTGPLPTLLTWSRSPGNDNRTDALASGILQVNDAGCFTLHTEILIAPPESTVLPDGTGIDLAGHGVVHIGEDVQGLTAAYGDITPEEPSPPGVTECLSASAPEKEYVSIWAP